MSTKITKQKYGIKTKVTKLSEKQTADVPAAIHTEELDPEVLEALKIKKKSKIKNLHDVDYIPELERDSADDDM